MNEKFDLNDIVIVPAEESDITSRSQCNINQTFEDWEMLPLIAAPMDTVVSMENYRDFIQKGIIPCVPRGTFFELRTRLNFIITNPPCFESFSLTAVEKELKDEEPFSLHSKYVLIDIANGHMKKLVDIVKEIKIKCPEIILMVGNVANPETFVKLGQAGADFIRCSVGTGAGCTTAANVAINYPLGSLISECRKAKIQHGLYHTNIVADGGMRNYSDIIKALALGADYVMVGSIFNKAIESAGFNYLWKIRINNKTAEVLWRWGFPIKKKYRGMSTKAVQRSWGKTNLVTAEGITKYQKVEYTLNQWTENFKDYLKSAMSYCNAKNLDHFIGEANYIFITNAARQRFEK